MSPTVRNGAHAASGVQYFPVHSPEADKFLDGTMTIEAYLAHARHLAEVEVAQDRRFGTAKHARIERASRSLKVLAQVIFLAVVPAAYLVLGIVFLSTTGGTSIGWVSIATGLAVGLVAALVVQLTRQHQARVNRAF